MQENQAKGQATEAGLARLNLVKPGSEQGRYHQRIARPKIETSQYWKDWEHADPTPMSDPQHPNALANDVSPHPNASANELPYQNASAIDDQGRDSPAPKPESQSCTKYPP